MLCETTLTQRHYNLNCKCNIYVGNLGPCETFELGSNTNCVYCDHNKDCHDNIIRDKVFAAEAFLKEQPQVKLETIHHFSKGVYAREIHIPAGIILTGEIHKFENLNILSKGRMQVLTENGVEEVEAPFTIVSPAGTKRIAYTLSECVWTTIHGTDLINVDDIEKVFIAKSEEEWLEFCGLNQLELKL